MAATFSIGVDENQTFKYTGTLKDEDEEPIGPADLATLTCTMYDQDTGTIINGRNGQNVLNANNFALTSALTGNLTWDAPSLDTPIIDDSKATEVHIALIEWTYGSPLPIYSGSKEIAIRVVNLVRVP